jgi:hypothetical protein
MRISIIAALAVLCLTLAAGTAWAYHAKVHIYVYNNDDFSHEVDVEYPGGFKLKTIDAGDYHEYEYSATAYAWDEVSYEYDVYVYEHDSGDKKCQTSIGVKTDWDFGVDLDQCTATASQTTACTVEVDKSGTTCQITVTINE